MSSNNNVWNNMIDRNHDQQLRNHDAEDDEFGEFEGFEAAQQFYADHPGLQADVHGAAGGGPAPPWGRFPDNVPDRRGAASGARPGALQPDLLPTRAGLHASCPMTDSGGSVGESGGGEGDGGGGGADCSGPDSDERAEMRESRVEPNRRGPLPDISSGSDAGQRPRAPLPDIQRGEAEGEPRLAVAVGGVVVRRSGRAPTAAPAVAEGRRACNDAAGGRCDGRDPSAPRPGEENVQERLARQVDDLHHQVSQLVLQVGELRQSEDSWRQRDVRHRELQQQLSRLERHQAVAASAEEGAMAQRTHLTEERIHAMLRESGDQQRALLDERLATFGAEVVRLVEASVESVVQRAERGAVAGTSNNSLGNSTVEATTDAVREALRNFSEEQKQREADRLRLLSECIGAVLGGARDQVAALLRPDS